ncbi:hypothetical protein [Oceanobacillus sojae]|uniref:hypothetical protein n=1 Tax=Oceanobacillus sojae TaxID=582851 RepID=UPI00098894B1|nr:hypothetical protein [Oceanobacillus sojae]
MFKTLFIAGYLGACALTGLGGVQVQADVPEVPSTAAILEAKHMTVVAEVYRFDETGYWLANVDDPAHTAIYLSKQDYPHHVQIGDKFKITYRLDAVKNVVEYE